MTETENDDLDGLAGEYVLGTLSGADRAQFEARLRIDAAAAHAVAAWSQRLQPLADAVQPAIPSASLWRRVAQEVGIPYQPAYRRWIAAALAAAILAAALFFGDMARQPSVTAIATLAPQDGTAAFTVSMREGRETLLVRAGTVDPLQNQSYELWVVPPSGAPVSLGLVNASGETERDVPRDKRPLLETGVILAVSLEPAGGSPTGAPTGPVLFTGALSTPQ